MSTVDNLREDVSHMVAVVKTCNEPLLLQPQSHNSAQCEDNGVRPQDDEQERPGLQGKHTE